MAIYLTRLFRSLVKIWLTIKIHIAKLKMLKHQDQNLQMKK